MYIQSNRGGEKYIADGYMYIYDKTSSNGKIKFWRCEFKSNKCRARIHTSVETNEVIKKMNDHKHEPNPQRIIATQMKNLLKRKVEILTAVPIKTELQEIPDLECSTNFSYAPQTSYIKEEPECKIIKKDDEESNPSSLLPMLDYIDIPKGLRVYDLGKGQKIKFLLNDFKGTNEILIFARDDYKHWARFMKTIFIDCTFRRCPYMYSQICVIMVKRNEFIFSIMYIFLQETKEESFKNMFQSIKNIWPEFNPAIIYTDFTKTLYAATKQEFPMATIKSCFFMLKDIFIEKLEEYDLQNIYNDDLEFSIKAKMIIAIAFLPKKDIEEAVYFLKNYLPKDLQQVLFWFEETFFGKFNKDKIKVTEYPYEMWSVHKAVIDGKYYTNDMIESTNKQIHTELETDSILVSQFIIGFQVLQRAADLVYDAFIKGEPPQVQNVHEKLKYLIKTYHDRTLYEFLRGVAINIF